MRFIYQNDALRTDRTCLSYVESYFTMACAGPTQLCTVMLYAHRETDIRSGDGRLSIGLIPENSYLN
jgi:hypothetical protein